MREQGVDDFCSPSARLPSGLASPTPRSCRATPRSRREGRASAVVRFGRHEADLSRLRRAALEALRLDGRFPAAPGGPVPGGTALRAFGKSTCTFADTPETVSIARGSGVPHEVQERRFATRARPHRSYPAIRFVAAARRSMPWYSRWTGSGSSGEPVDGKPMRRRARGRRGAALARVARRAFVHRRWLVRRAAGSGSVSGTAQVRPCRLRPRRPAADDPRDGPRTRCTACLAAGSLACAGGGCELARAVACNRRAATRVGRPRRLFR